MLNLPNRTKLERPKLDRPKRRLRDLSGDRRFALASRGSLGMQRALWPLTPREHSTGHLSTWRQVPALAALMLLRPVLVLLPLAARPSAVALVVGAVLTAHHATGDAQGAPRETAMILLSIVVLAAVMGLVSAVRSILRWRRIDDAVPSEVPAADIVSLL